MREENAYIITQVFPEHKEYSVICKGKLAIKEENNNELDWEALNELGCSQTNCDCDRQSISTALGSVNQTASPYSDTQRTQGCAQVYGLVKLVFLLLGHQDPGIEYPPFLSPPKHLLKETERERAFIFYFTQIPITTGSGSR